MIKYALRCDQAHTWDAWFPSISGYDEQQARGLVDCPFCGSTKVEKAPMAPAVVTSRAATTKTDTDIETKSVEAPETTLPVVTEPTPLAMPEPLKAMLSELKERIEKTHDYVGDTFAKEVRAMHEGETEHRPIYGEATAKEVKELLEDDIPVAPLPVLASPKGTKGVH
jgi:hypothetical protein